MGGQVNDTEMLKVFMFFRVKFYEKDFHNGSPLKFSLLLNEKLQMSQSLKFNFLILTSLIAMFFNWNSA